MFNFLRQLCFAYATVPSGESCKEFPSKILSSKKNKIKSKLKGQILGASAVFNKPRIIIEKTFPTIIPFDPDFAAKPCLWRLS